MSHRSDILTNKGSSQSAVCRVECEVCGVVSSNAFDLSEVLAVALLCIVDVHTTAKVNDGVGEPETFFLGHQVPVPSFCLCILSIELLRFGSRFRNNHADHVVLVCLEDEEVLSSLGGLETYISLVVFALRFVEPPTRAVAVRHSSRLLHTIPSGVVAQHFDNLELIETVCLQRDSEAQGVTVTSKEFRCTDGPVVHCTGDEIVRFRSFQFHTVQLDGCTCSRNCINVVFLENKFLGCIQVVVTLQNLVDRKDACQFGRRSTLIDNNEILVIILFAGFVNGLTVIIERNFYILFRRNNERCTTGFLRTDDISSGRIAIRTYLNSVCEFLTCDRTHVCF